MLKRILKISALFVSIILIALMLAMLTACESKQDNPDIESTVSYEEVIGRVEDDERQDNVTETIVDNHPLKYTLLMLVRQMLH